MQSWTLILSSHKCAAIHIFSVFDVVINSTQGQTILCVIDLRMTDNSSWLPHDNGQSDAKVILIGGFNMCGERSAKNSI